MHDCLFCGMACDCDGEDHCQPAPVDCLCPCTDFEDSDDYEPDDSDSMMPVDDVEGEG